MGSSSSKFKKYLQHGDEFAAMQVNHSIALLAKQMYEHVFQISKAYERLIYKCDQIDTNQWALKRITMFSVHLTRLQLTLTKCPKF
jgi:hypothetical protein